MSRRTLRAGVAGGVTAFLVLLGVAAQADPVPGSPGTPLAGTDSQLYAGVGADAFAELSNNFVAAYDATDPAKKLESFDAVDPVTGSSTSTIETKPGCSGIPRPNGANAGINALLNGQVSDAGSGGDGTTFCIDWVRSSRAKGSAAAEQNLTFYAQSRDAVGYAVIGNAYAPTAPLTTAQLKDIFECTDTNWSQVGGQPGPIHVYLPPDTAATLTFFLQAIGSSLTSLHTGCDGRATTFTTNVQQNDGRTLNGDPMGIAPYAITKWAAQENADLPSGVAPAGISDFRGGAHIGYANQSVEPTTATTFNGHTYQALNPSYAAGSSASFGRIFYNVVRNSAPSDLQDVFGADGYLCQNANDLLIPFGNTPLPTEASGLFPYCGQPF